MSSGGELQVEILKIEKNRIPFVEKHFIPILNNAEIKHIERASVLPNFDYTTEYNIVNGDKKITESVPSGYIIEAHVSSVAYPFINDMLMWGISIWPIETIERIKQQTNVSSLLGVTPVCDENSDSEDVLKSDHSQKQQPQTEEYDIEHQPVESLLWSDASTGKNSCKHTKVLPDFTRARIQIMTQEEWRSGNFSSAIHDAQRDETITQMSQDFGKRPAFLIIQTGLCAAARYLRSIAMKENWKIKDLLAAPLYKKFVTAIYANHVGIAMRTRETLHINWSHEKGPEIFLHQAIEKLQKSNFRYYNGCLVHGSASLIVENLLPIETPLPPIVTNPTHWYIDIGRLYLKIPIEKLAWIPATALLKIEKPSTNVTLKKYYSPYQWKEVAPFHFNTNLWFMPHHAEQLSDYMQMASNKLEKWTILKTVACFCANMHPDAGYTEKNLFDFAQLQHHQRVCVTFRSGFAKDWLIRYAVYAERETSILDIREVVLDQHGSDYMIFSSDWIHILTQQK